MVAVMLGEDWWITLLPSTHLALHISRCTQVTQWMRLSPNIGGPGKGQESKVHGLLFAPVFPLLSRARHLTGVLQVRD